MIELFVTNFQFSLQIIQDFTGKYGNKECRKGKYQTEKHKMPRSEKLIAEMRKS